ncbi:hypothetical protein JK635_02340 [Neobacillus sp. YIM B02564]|uniref:Uncharacterized protein n=1 Tax=Neobacillus paridis TaxID=2803862 RepID=A0ABS1TJ70_9BACI|nr:hypothetical protein [Neobacillus paridis]MBL4951079.1 hypothetical protein [Neobacillus paridis]
MNNENLIKIQFSYIDESNQESTLKKTYTATVMEDTGALEKLTEDFKTFIKVIGFTDEWIDRIQLLEEDDEHEIEELFWDEETEEEGIEEGKSLEGEK